MMNETNVWIRFMLAALSTWRITHLLVSEDGPADIFVRIRLQLGSGFFGKLMDCFYCLSFWVAAPMALFVFQTPLNWLFGWMALSGAACLLERIGQEPVIIQPLSKKEGDTNDGMLWTETISSEQSITDISAGSNSAK